MTLIINNPFELEEIAKEVHNYWWREKEKQGFHPPEQCENNPKECPEKGYDEWIKFKKHCDKCHTDMYPYDELAEYIKEYDRVTVRAVLNAIYKRIM